MNLQISLFALAIIAVFYAIAAIGLIPLWRWFKGRFGKALVIVLAVIALALPWADEIWIAWHFAELCKSAGVHVKRKVGVAGFVDATSSSRTADALKIGPIGKRGELADFEKAGYRFKEYLLKDGRVWHLEREDDQLMASIRDRPAGRFHYKFADRRQEVPVGLKLEKRETIVIDSETGETLATDTRYNRYPGWVESLWIRFFGSGLTTCEGSAPKPPSLRHLLYHYVLIPVDAKQ